MNNEPVVKPKIRADLWTRSGFSCRSKEGPTWHGQGARFVVATGDTMEEAYANWQRRRELLNALTEDPATPALYKHWVFESEYRRTINPFIRLIRRLTHRKDGTKR